MSIPNNGGPNLTRRIIDLPANNANPKFIPIYATGPCKGWRVRESICSSVAAALASQGYQIKIPNDNSAAGFTTVFQRPVYSANIAPEDLGFENWNQISAHGPYGDAFANAANPTPGFGLGATTATILCYACSLTGTATSVEIVEYF
jgi:hypothetical protein